MALDLSGLTIPERKYEGLYKVADTLASQETAEAKAAAAASKTAEANKVKLRANLEKMANPSEYLSGTAADPQIINGYYDMLSEGYDLIDKGENENVVRARMATKSKVLSNYAVTAKNAKKIIDDQISSIGGTSGYDKTRLMDLATKRIFFNDDGTPKDISTISISQSPVLDVIKDYPELVTTNQGLDEWLKGQNPSLSRISVVTGSKPGKVSKRDIEITAPSWAIPENNDKGVFTGKVVPQYEIAKDGDEAIFVDKQPVRMVTPELAESILSNSPATADYIRGKVKTHIQRYKDEGGQPLSLNDPRIDMVTRAELYNELQNRISKSYRDAKSDVTSIKGGNTINYNFGGGQYSSGGQTTGNVLDEIGKLERISTKSGNYVQNGILYSPNNSALPGRKELYLNVERLPASLKSVVKSGGGMDLDELDGVNVIFENGQIIGMKTDFGVIDRNTINNYQQKFNTESLKAPQPTFGSSNKKTSNVPDNLDNL